MIPSEDTLIEFVNQCKLYPKDPVFVVWEITGAEKQIEQAISAAVAAEREAIYALIDAERDECDRVGFSEGAYEIERISTAIRARGEATK